ncbi:MAG: hypothetical protein ACI8UO_004946 [Verrucomicrobiales bacterium]|jgi:hypothetical protein
MIWRICIPAAAALALVIWFATSRESAVPEKERPAEKLVSAPAEKLVSAPAEKLVSAPAESKSKPASPSPFIVGEVEFVSRIPDAASSEYPDCAGRIIVKTADGDRLCTGVVFQDRKPTSFGRVAVGARVRLQVRPTDQVSRSTIARYRLVDDTERYDLDPWWVDRIEVVGSQRLRVPETQKAKISDLAAAESAYIRYALHTTKASMIGGVGSDFFFYGDRRFYRDRFWEEADSIGIRECLLQFHEFLAERNIELYVAMVPVSSSIYPDHAVNQFFDPAIHEPPNQPVLELFRELAGDGVQSVDLTSAFLRQRWTEFEGERYPIYRPNDTHWAPAGARIAAKEIAKVLRDKTSQQAHLDRVPPETFEETSQLMEFEADIVEILGRKFPHWAVEIKPHLTPSHEISATGEAEHWLKVHEHPESPIHMVGDSFIHKLYATNSGLHAHLTRELAAPINLHYRYGAGGQVIQEWVDSTDLSKVKIVILAIAEKYACFDHMWKPLRASDSE